MKLRYFMPPALLVVAEMIYGVVIDDLGWMFIGAVFGVMWITVDAFLTYRHNRPSKYLDP